MPTARQMSILVSRGCYFACLSALLVTGLCFLGLHLDHMMPIAIEHEVWLRLPIALGVDVMPYVRYAERVYGMLLLQSAIGMLCTGPRMFVGWAFLFASLLMQMYAVSLMDQRNNLLSETAQHKLPGLHESLWRFRYSVAGLFSVACVGFVFRPGPLQPRPPEA